MQNYPFVIVHRDETEAARKSALETGAFRGVRAQTFVRSDNLTGVRRSWARAALDRIFGDPEDDIRKAAASIASQHGKGAAIAVLQRAITEMEKRQEK